MTQHHLLLSVFVYACLQAPVAISCKKDTSGIPRIKPPVGLAPLKIPVHKKKLLEIPSPDSSLEEFTNFDDASTLTVSSSEKTESHNIPNPPAHVSTICTAIKKICISPSKKTKK